MGVWAGIPADRVVAVVAELANGRTQWGSGFLVAGDRVLTAWHCANDKASGDAPRSLSVIRKVDGGQATVDHVLSSPGIDVAVLVLRSRSWTEDWDPPKYGRVDRTHTGLLKDCQAIGYPLFQVDARYRQRNTAELHGVIRRTDDAESGFLLMRDPTLETVSVPVDVGDDRGKPDPAWGGLSGALVFHQGYALGVVVEHHPRQGLAAVRILPVDRIAVATEAGGRDVAAALGLPAPADLPMLTGSMADRDGQADAGPAARASRRIRLQSYLAAAQAAASEHPYALGIADAPPLGTVYLSQKLGAQVDHAAPPPAMDPNTGVTTDRVRQALQRFDIGDVLECNQGALIIGAPGAGKSSLLRHVIDALAYKRTGAEQYDFIPVLMHARALLGSLPINKSIARAMREDLGARLDDVDLDDLFADLPAPGVPWLVLLDGLDEIFEVSSRRQVIDIVRRWWGDPRYRFLLASRPLPERELRVLQTAAIPIFEIQPFSEDQLPLLARGWFRALGVADAAELTGIFIAQLRQSRMAQLARNPLIATIACVVYASNPDHELSYGRADLYEKFIVLLLEKLFADGRFLSTMKERIGRYDPQAIAAVDDLVRGLRSLLQKLAALRFKGSAPSLRAATSQLADSYRPPAVPESSWNQLVAELLAQTGLISAQADDLVFNHDTIIEYLAACARAASSGSGRLGIRERWSLVTRAGSSESYALFVVALLRRRGLDLVGRPPALLQARKLLHARLVAALVNDGYDLMPEAVTAATRRLSAIAARRANGLPDWLHEAIFEEDDYVMAAKALALIDKDRGLDLLFTLAADPKVEDFSVFDVLAETMRMEELTDINSARAISVLYRFASAPGAVINMEELTAVDSARAIPVLYRFASDPSADIASPHRMLIAGLVQERDPELGAALLKTLAGDSSMDTDDRLDCIERLAETERPSAINALADVITDRSTRQNGIMRAYRLLCELDEPAAIAALSQIANDETRSVHARAMAAMALYRDGWPAGTRILFEIATDQATPGFHRVYYFAEFGDHGDKTSRLLALSRDSTLPNKWRLSAAEELLSCGRDEGIDALRAIQHDESFDGRLRRRLRISLFAYRWLARRADAGALRSKPETVPGRALAYLLPDERGIRAQRLHIAVLLKPFALLFSCLLAAGTLSAVFPQGLTLAVIWAVWGALLLHFGWKVAEWSSGYIVVSNVRLFVHSGVLTRTINIFPANAVRDMYFERSLPGCALGYGKFSIACWIPGGLHLKYLARPEQLYSDMVSMAMPKESMR